MIIYLAGDSARWESSRQAMQTLEEVGHTVPYRWDVEASEFYQDPNHQLSPTEARRIATDCNKAMAACEVLVLLAEGEVMGSGKWVELGKFTTGNKPIFILAPNLSTKHVFCYEEKCKIVDSLEELITELAALELYYDLL